MKHKKIKILVTVVLLFAIVSFSVLRNDTSVQDDDGWTVIFNGKDLNGWEQLNGEADFMVENGEIIGITKSGTPNSFLCTEAKYGDFILEFEVMVHPDLNSGVQFRSNSLKDYNNYRVHGYQFELDPSPRAFSGGIYDEARRGWLYPLSRNVKGQTAFKNGRWNHCRIEAIGTTINTWINGIQCSRLKDAMTSSGFFGLQVHGISNAEDAGKTIKWRNIRIKSENLEKERWKPDPEVEEMSYLVNKLSEWEKRHGWRLLWDGSTGNGWRGAKLDHFPESGWEIKDGILTIMAKSGEEATGPGDIVTEDVFSEFDLELEFMITEGANSGIKYFVNTELNKETGSAIGCEFQLLDDSKHPDASLGVSGNRTLGSLYDLIPADNISVPGRAKQFKGVNRWNKARIVVRGNQVEHWLNNEKVVEYDRGSQMFRALVANSKYSKWPGFGQWPGGHILLQDHGNTVHFRSIKIKEF